MKEKLGDLQRLQHISKCISDLEEILKGVDADSFYRNSEKKYAVERVMEIIGEAINKTSKETLAKSNQPIPWRDVVDLEILLLTNISEWTIQWFTNSPQKKFLK